MKTLVLVTLFYIVNTDLQMRFHPERPLHWLLAEQHRKRGGAGRYSPEEIGKAVDFACVLYFKSVLCLQRSVVTTLLLRRNHHPAQLVIGAQSVPFKSHAWVELHGVVVNDRPYIAEVEQELIRC
jgi:prolyl oligopeptidase